MKALQDGDPRRVGPYELLGVLGAGGMGRVYLGRLGEVLVAVKVINEELTQNGDFIARFRREVTATRAMSGPYFAAIVDHDVDAEQPWLATEYVPGPTLNAVIAEHGPLDVVSVRALGVRLAQALGAIHAAGLVHRDVKPGNILLGADGPRLIDFGIARGAAVTTLTQTGVLGTPQFMAPEQLQVRGRVTAAADVFALGLVLAFAATGEHPFGQTDSFAFGFRIVHEEPDLEQVPADLAGAVRRCLAKDPGERPTPGQLGAMLGLGEETLDRSGLAVLIRHAGDTEIPSPPRTPTERNHVERPPRRRRAPIALAAVVAVAVGTAVTVALAPGGGTPQGLGPTGTSPTGSAVSVTPTAPTASADPGSPTATTPPPPSPAPQASGSAPVTEPPPTGGTDGSSGGAAGGTTGGGKSTGSTSGSAGGTGNAAGGGGGTPGGNTAAPAPAPRTTPAPTPTPTPPPPPQGSPPAAMPGYNATFDHGCVGACDMPLTMTWSAQPDATRYDVRYDNQTRKVNTVYSTSGTSYHLTGPYSGDHVCIALRAANQYGASAWTETYCFDTPY
ncbi:serine/threonine protein kinase [Kitasatospora gansuensis]|uniref:Serine/threonine protein kinase n=1 Tax=Kitasatospora gansuensis TaxID=258050 RepID=A0A7W7SM83_9ACTN|nr:serine/threonine-protein kinase [Kitasatospora gansuensis]MBB4951866.1 serine/threonine protein kinase [Kitasatospora gansuensis]